MAAGRRTILHRVTLAVDRATSCALIGPSGAGKSTLLRAIAGLVDHDGEIALGSRGLTGVAPHRRQVGLLFQEPRLFPSMSAVDNVAYPLRVRRVARRTRRQAAAHLLEEVGLGDRLAARSHELSGGERQRVALARALCAEPDVLLLDEPLTGLDGPQRRDLVRMLNRVRSARPVTWVVVSHDPDDALSLADTVAVLDAGRLVQHDDVAALLRQPASALVASLTGNPNLLQGEVQRGRLRLGRHDAPWPAADGPVTLTIRPEHLRSGQPDHPTRDRDPGRHTDPVSRWELAMTVAAVERRAGRPVILATSSAGHLEVPLEGRPPVVGAAVSVRFEARHLWPLPNVDQAAEAGGPPADQTPETHDVRPL